MARRRSGRHASALGLAAATGLLSGCSVLSINPTLELAKAGSAMALGVIATGPSSARNSVYHEHPEIDAVCVEYDPTTTDPDIVPALQQELKAHQIESRIVDIGGAPPSCRYRVSDTAQIEWEVPPAGSGYQPYLRDATLTLRNQAGAVLASSAYGLEGAFQMGKWASRRSKLAPVVTQLVTGFDH